MGYTVWCLPVLLLSVAAGLIAGSWFGVVRMLGGLVQARTCLQN
jgi:hypothetical protein